MLRSSFAVWMGAVCQQAFAATILTSTFDATFTASQSLWGGGPAFSANFSGRTPGAVGAYYSVHASTGEVTATQAGKVSAQHPDRVEYGHPLSFSVGYAGSSGLVQSQFGAAAQAGVFLDISGCLGATVFGACIGIPYSIDEQLALLDRGFSLTPATSHVPVLDVQRAASDSDQVVGLTAGLDVVIGRLGATLGFDLDQTIRFTPTALAGTVVFQHLASGARVSQPFLMPAAAPLSISASLGGGSWRVSLENVVLQNLFRNEIDLALRPSLDYIVGSWSPGHLDIPLIDESFSLSFNRIGSLGSFDVFVEDTPEPGTLVLCGLGLVAVGYSARRTSARRARSTTCSSQR